MNYTVNTPQDLSQVLEENEITSISHEVLSFPAVICIEKDKVIAVATLQEFYPDEGEVISGITKALNWHDVTFANGIADSINLPRLCRCQSYLVRQIEYLGQIVARANKDKKLAEYSRRRKRDALILSYRASGKTQAEASAQARVETSALDEIHANSIEYYDRLKAMQDSVNSTIMAVSQERKQMEIDLNRTSLAA